MDVGRPVAGWAPYFRDFHWKRSLLGGYIFCAKRFASLTSGVRLFYWNPGKPQYNPGGYPGHSC